MENRRKISLKIPIILAELRRQFEGLYGPQLVRMVLFGSHARGDAGPGSDQDILVVLRGQVNPGEEIAGTGKVAAALSLEYNVVISCTFVSAVRYAKEQNPFLLNVRNEGIAI